MYYPYFRGKQNELIAIKEQAELISDHGFAPIIEPVKQNMNGLMRTLDALKESGAAAVLIVNPKHGDFRRRNDQIIHLLSNRYSDYPDIRPGLLMDANSELVQFPGLRSQFVNRPVALVHKGFNEASVLARLIRDDAEIDTSIFINSDSLYRRHFNFHPTRVLVRDGFIKRVRNSDHPDAEEFSTLHLTFAEEGATNFGDFLIVGDEFSETGGPAYTVAIHLTYIDPHNDDRMYIRHFKSDSQDTPTDPGGKFLEALAKLIEHLDELGCLIEETEAIGEFRSLYARRHFPGLGTVKKLAMKHHIETLALFFDE
ncbi:sce7725 family protein [Thalassospira sp. SN3W]|uniref:sce7725 family protein n=1 Tax=Thalassospira sp. SN3W TaxID=3035476 RepID=UPI00311AC88B